MPVYVLAFGVAFSFFMFVIPSKSFITKVILCIGLSAAANLVFVIFAPEWAMTILGENE